MHAPVRRERHLVSLDAIRGIAALSVVFWHWQHFYFVGSVRGADYDVARLPFGHALSLLYDFGWLGVDVFFTISGFIFYKLYADRIRVGDVGAGRFAMLRFSRLYPLHLLMLLVVAALQLIALRQTGSFFVYPANDPTHFVLHLFFISPYAPADLSFNGPTWTVTIELALYVAFFAICRAAPRRLAIPVACVLAAVGFLVIGRWSFELRGIGSFFIGGGMYFAWCAIADSTRAAYWRSVVTFGYVVVVVVTIVYLWLGIDLSTTAPTPLVPPSRVDHAFHVALKAVVFRWIPIVVFPWTVLAFALNDDRMEIVGRPFALLGEISYSSYLIHFPLQLLVVVVATGFGVDHAIYRSPAFLVVYFGLLIVLSVVSFRTFEKPMQDRIRAWAARRALALAA